MNRPKRVSAAAAVVVAVLAVAGCGGSSSSSKNSSTSSSSGTTTTSGSSGATTTTVVAGTAATLAVSANASLGKDVIVDGTGKTVYLFQPDGANTTSQVPDGIKALWPAVPATATPTAGTGLDSSKIGSQTQPDGTKQVTYNGHLLYTFKNDSAPGDAKGQGLGGIWFTLSPAGDKNA